MATSKKLVVMNVPDSLKYTKEHEWIKVLENNTALVGITEFAAKELGDIVYIEIETLGETIEMSEPFGTIEAVKTVSDMFMPVSGKIIEVNQNIINKPEIVNNDPYGEGWFIKIEMIDPSQLEKLMSAEEYLSMVQGHN